MKLYDVKQAAEILGLSPWTVRARIRRGELRPVRIGRLVRLEEEEIQKFIASGKNHNGAPKLPEARK